MARKSVQGANLEPIRNYIEAKEIHSQARDAASTSRVVKILSKAVGSEKSLPALKENLDKALESEGPLSDMVLGLVLSETRKK